MPRFACMELMWGDVAGACFEAWLDEVRALGFEGVAVRSLYVQPFLAEPRAFAELLKKRRLALAGVYLRIDEAPAQLEGLCAFLKQNGCADLILYGGTAATEAERAAAAQQIDALGAQGAAHGIVTTYHHHSGNYFETLEQTEAFLQRTDPRHVGLFCDTGHAAQDFEGHPRARRALLFLERNWARVRYIEFKEWSAELGLSTELGHGQTDFEALAGLILRKHYPGWITLEQNAPTPGSKPGECAGRSLRFAKKAFEKAACGSAAASSG
ncbi:MAG: TIM barrel protein [Planctomycetes bacterium]|nr:TIM barrel protein [Planctomycetota bacterium]